MLLNHNELAEDLAYSIGQIAYQNVSLGSVWLAGRGKGPGKADVVKIRPSYNKFCVSIYEVKASRSDFLSDIRSEKWKKYIPHCHRFYFAINSGVAEKDEIPEPAGLYVRGEKGWSAIKGAKPMDNEIPRETLKSLLFVKSRLSAADKARIETIKYIDRNQQIDSLGRFRYDQVRKMFGERITDALKQQEDYYLAHKELLNRVKDVEEVIRRISEAAGIEDRWGLSLYELRKRLGEIEKDVNNKERPIHGIKAILEEG